MIDQFIETSHSENLKKWETISIPNSDLTFDEVMVKLWILMSDYATILRTFFAIM